MRRRKTQRTPRNLITQRRVTHNVAKRKLFLPEDFDWELYVSSHNDLQRAGITTKEKAEEHFLRVGHTENRIYSKSSGLIRNSEKPEAIDSTWLTKVLSRKKGVVYTCVSGSYDTLKEPLETDPHWDYICFTDMDLKSKVWDVRPIPSELNNLPQAKRARALKILPHKYLPEYDYSFWIDASILIKRAVTPFVSQALRNESGRFAIPKHPDRICVYEEGSAVTRMKKDAADVVEKQIKKYKSQGYPSNWGMVQSGLMIRRKSDDVINFCNKWWKEVKEGSKRDQLSFNYVLWRHEIPVQVINPAAFGSLYFHLYSHKTAKKDPFPIRFRRDYGRLENYINGKRV